ncbi:MAG: hypothetical protein QOD70_1675 [Frankiales bacterium]|nr:hypothetical protein [Frankiales bacterium]
MNSKLIKASLAGLAAIGLATAGSTFAAFSDFGNINGSQAGAGILKLNLAAGPGTATTMDFAKLYPGQSKQQFVWLASEDISSATPHANLALTIHNLSDTGAACATSLGKASADPGCVVDPTTNAISGTPSANSAGTGNGHLSQALTTYVEVFKNATSATCSAALGTWTMGTGQSLLNTAAGDLADPTQGAVGAGHKTVIKDPSTGLPLDMKAGDGVCVGVSTYWDNNHVGTPALKAAQDLLDNSAQGDSMKFDMHFDLTQV